MQRKKNENEKKNCPLDRSENSIGIQKYHFGLRDNKNSYDEKGQVQLPPA